MTDHRARYGPHNPDETYVAHDDRGAARRPRRGPDELRDRGRPVVAGAAAHPGPDRVVVGLRGGHAAARRALPGVRRRPAGPGPQHAHARPLHARQHRQRPGPLPRPGRRAAGDRERPVLGRRPLRLAVGVRQARSGASPRSTRTRRCSRRRSGPPSGPGIRQCIGPMFDLWSTFLGDQWSIGAWDAMREGSAARPAGAPAVHPGARRAAAEPQGVRPRVGPVVLDRDRRAPPATTSGCCAASRSPRCCSRTTCASSTTPAASCSARCPTSRPSGCRPSSPAPASTVRLPVVPRRRPLDARRPARALRRDPPRLGQEPRPVSAPRAIDVHAHYLPEPYRAALLANGHAQPDGFPQIPDWSAEEHVAADGPARDRDVAAVDLVARRAPRRRRGDAATWPAR